VPLMRCFECGREISEYADACPGCGYVLDSRPDENASDERIEYWLWKCTGWKWRVIGRESGRALVLTNDVLETRPFDDGTGEVTSWKTCTLREYLNGPFFDALPVEVRERVVRICNTDTADPEQSTEDRVFLLSAIEVEAYLKGRDRCADGAGDDDDDPSEPYDEPGSPLEVWHADSRQHVKSSHDEWAEEYDSVLESEAAYNIEREHCYMDESSEEESNWWANWRYRGWWLRTASDLPDQASASDYDMMLFASRHQGRFHSLEDTEYIRLRTEVFPGLTTKKQIDMIMRAERSGVVRCTVCGSDGDCSPRGVESFSATEPLGVRVALCVDVSSRPNSALDTAAMKPVSPEGDELGAL
jgi:hypothetical protein